MRTPFKFKLACLALAIQAGYPALASAVTYEHRYPVPKLSVMGSSSTTGTGSSTGAGTTSGGASGGGATSTGTGGTGTGSSGTSGDTGTSSPTAPTPAPVVTLSTSALNFGALTSGQTGSAAVVLTNTGDAVLNLTQPPAVSGDSAFSSQTNCQASLAPSASCSTTVSFLASSGGEHRGLLLFATNASATPTEVSLTGSALQAQGVLSAATSSDFGTVPVGQPVSRTFVFSNPGNAAATGVVATLSANPELALTANTCGVTGSPVTVAAGGSCSMTITWSPVSNGMLSAASLAVNGTFAGNPTSIALTGTAAGAVASLSTSSLAFGDVNVGASDAKSVLLTNTGNDTLTFSVAPGVTGDAAYTAQTDCGASLLAGQACTTNVTFAPMTAGAKTGALRFQSNAYTGADQTVSLTGSGKSLLGTLGLTPSTVAFGAVVKNGPAATATLTLNNAGTVSQPLTVGAVSAPFSKTGTTCGTSLAAGGNCTVSLSYAPTADADYSTGYSLPLTWGAAHEAASVSLTGTVVDSAVSAPSLAFPDTAVGATAQAQTVTLSNPGSAPLTVGTPTTAAPFATSYTCGADLAPGQNCLVSVTYSPTAATTQSGTLTIPTGAGNQVVPLSGKGLSALSELSLSATSLLFGPVTLSTTATQTITVRNNGSVSRALTVGSPAAPYSATSNCGTSLAPNATCTITVSFTPTTNQSYSASGTVPLMWGPLNEAKSIGLTGGIQGDGVSLVGACAATGSTACAQIIGKGTNFSASYPSGTVLPMANVATKSSGKWYFEVSNLNAYSYLFLGENTTACGPANGTLGYFKELINGSSLTTNVFGVAIDVDAKTAGIYKNGTLQSTVALGSPNVVRVAVAANVCNVLTTFNFNFGQNNFKYPVPAGYNAGLW